MGNNRNKKRITLEDIKFTSFYRALISDDYSDINVDGREHWLELTEEFMSLSDMKINPLEKQIEKLSVQHSILIACVIILTKEWTREFADICGDNGVVWDKKISFEENMQRILDKIEEINRKIKLLKSELPKRPKIKEGDEKSLPYKILGNLSSSLGYSVNFNMSVAEYIALRYAMKQKADSLKDLKNKRNGRR